MGVLTRFSGWSLEFVKASRESVGPEGDVITLLAAEAL